MLVGRGKDELRAGISIAINAVCYSRVQPTGVLYECAVKAKKPRKKWKKADFFQAPLFSMATNDTHRYTRPHPAAVCLCGCVFCLFAHNKPTRRAHIYHTDVCAVHHRTAPRYAALWTVDRCPINGRYN